MQQKYYNDQTILYFNGEYIKAINAKTDLYSQSLHYGYSVFEGIRAYKTIKRRTKIFKAQEHFERLRQSTELIGIPYPYDNAELITVSYELLEKNNLKDGYIRPLVFCPPNMTLQHAKQSFIVIEVWEWGAYLGDNLIRVMTSSFERPNPKAFRILAKAGGHYINSIMACQEAKDKGFDEALLLDSNGYVAEGPGANVFFEKEGKVCTPPKGNILPGITRATVLEICNELSIPLEEKLFNTSELKQADAVFYCGTAAEIIGWQSLDDVIFKKPWNDTESKVIQDAYKCLVLEKEDIFELK